MPERGALLRIERPICLLAAVLLVAHAPAAAQPTENSVKAAFLPKFARYVEWPIPARPAAGSPIMLCVIGKDPFGGLIDSAVEGQRVGQNPVAVRRIADAANAGGCHVAYVRGGGSANTGKMLAALGGQPVLTITDSRDGSARGMIHFALERGRVGFHVDDAAAARSGLTISSRLLALALSVKQRRP